MKPTPHRFPTKFVVWMSIVALASLTSWSRLAWGDDPRSERLDADFQVQGEYVGEVAQSNGMKKLGVQIISLGKGKFHAVLRRGGLPGDGWDKNEMAPREGETAAGVTTFKADDQTVTIKDGSMTLTTDG